jgi:hypothetical protein
VEARLSLLSVLADVIKYGPTAEKVLGVVDQIDAIDGGGLFAKVETVLLRNGIDVEGALAGSVAAMADPVVTAIQVKLNSLGASPTLEVDGILGPATVRAISARLTGS